MPTTQKLPCELREHEKLEKGQRLSMLLAQRAQTELDAKEAAAEAKAELKRLDREGNEIAEQLRSGVEWREIEVFDRKVWATNEIVTFRRDTGAVVSRREMTAHERQREMFAPPSDESPDPDNDNGEPSSSGGNH